MNFFPIERKRQRCRLGFLSSVPSTDTVARKSHNGSQSILIAVFGGIFYLAKVLNGLHVSAKR